MKQNFCNCCVASPKKLIKLLQVSLPEIELQPLGSPPPCCLIFVLQIFGAVDTGSEVVYFDSDAQWE